VSLILRLHFRPIPSLQQIPRCILYSEGYIVSNYWTRSFLDGQAKTVAQATAIGVGFGVGGGVGFELLDLV
jgi:hypothetical protein